MAKHNLSALLSPPLAACQTSLPALDRNKYVAGSQRAATLEDIPGGRIRRNRPRGAAAPDPIMGFLSSNGRDWPPPLLVDGRLPDGTPLNQMEGNEGEEEANGLPSMPAGINVEEARYMTQKPLACMFNFEAMQPDIALLPESRDFCNPSNVLQEKLHTMQQHM